MSDINFANPEFFWLFLFIPVLTLWYIFRNKKMFGSIKVSSFGAYSEIKPSFRQRARHLVHLLRIASIALFIVALARPQSKSTRETIETEGIDIVMSLDVSTSMLAEDFKPNRIEAAKELSTKFIEERPNDRIGLVVFAGESFTQCHVTIDHKILQDLLSNIESGMIADGTAIGMGLATSVNRLKESKSESKVVILLTDGVNNTGFVAPQTAAEIASGFDIRVYTIGVGTKGKAPYPVQTPFGIRYRNVDVQIDEDILKEIADVTGGQYFRATDNESLQGIYEEIDRLEKTRIDVAVFNKYTEEFLPFAIAAIILLALEILLRNTWLRSMP